MLVDHVESFVNLHSPVPSLLFVLFEGSGKSPPNLSYCVSCVWIIFSTAHLLYTNLFIATFIRIVANFLNQEEVLIDELFESLLDVH